MDDNLMQIAENIIEFGADAALGEHMTGKQMKEWLVAAQAFIDTNGDDADLRIRLDELDLWDEYHSQALTYQDRHGGDYMDWDQWKETMQ